MSNEAISRDVREPGGSRRQSVVQGRHRSRRHAAVLSELARRAGDARGAGDARSQPDRCGDTEPEIAPNRKSLTKVVTNLQFTLFARMGT